MDGAAGGREIDDDTRLDRRPTRERHTPPCVTSISGATYHPDELHEALAGAVDQATARQALIPLRADAPEKFWRRVNKSNGCWEWTGPRTPHGYGTFSVRHGVVAPAHRVAWQFTYGAIPDGLRVCHHCDNPPCVRPDHLFLGTPADNSADMARKGRSSRNHQRWNNKVSVEQVQEIDRLYAAGASYCDIARRYGITKSGARGIVKRYCFRYVPRPDGLISDRWARTSAPAPKRQGKVATHGPISHSVQS